MLIAIVLIGVGSFSGGCRAIYTSRNSYSYYMYDYHSAPVTYSISPAACSALVVGCIMLIPVLLLLFLPFCLKE